MLQKVLSLPSGRVGVIDDAKPDTLIVPVSYESISFQKYGIIATNSDDSETSFTFTGQPIIRNGKNTLFLRDNYILTCNNSNECLIANISNRQYLFDKIAFQEILVFIGSREQAISYPSKLNLNNFHKLFDSEDYRKHGAHLENLLCAKLNGYWGVVDLNTGDIYAEFIYPTMVQCTNSRIGAKDSNNIILSL